MKRATSRKSSTAENLLDLLEHGWSRRLRGCATVAEAEPEREPDLVLAAAGALGGLPPDAVSRRWPACLVMAVAGTMIVGYRHGSPWPYWWRACGRRGATAHDAARWGAALRDAWTALGLPDFPDLDAGEAVLLHAGISDASADIGDRGEHSPRLVLEPFGRGPLLCSDTDSNTESDADADANREAPGPGPAVPGDAAGRLMAFDEDGRLIPETEPLPRDVVWLLHPADAAPTADRTLRAVLHGRLPLTWSGWVLVQVDLEDVSWIAPAGDTVTDRREVGGRSKPRLLTDAASDQTVITALRLVGDDSLGVHTSAPRLRLPAGALTWQVEIRRRGGPVLASHSLTGAADVPTDTDLLWRGLPRPLLGAYTVRVGGQPGRGLQRTVVLAEGLALVCHPAVRLLCPDGLEPSEVVPHPAAGMTSAPSALSFDAGTAARVLDLMTRDRRDRFTVTPPRMTASVDGADTPHAPDGPLRISLGRLATSTAPRITLHVTLPGARRAPALELIAADGRTVQALEAYRDGGYNVRRLLDTAGELDDTVLALDHDGRRATVAWVDGRTGAADDPWLPRLGA